MKKTAMTLALSGLLAFTTVGCAVTRDQSTVGEYVDDATITTRVKAKFAEDPKVSAMAISVETLKGFEPLISDDVRDVLDPASSTERKLSKGSTAKKEILAQITSLRAILN